MQTYRKKLRDMLLKDEVPEMMSALGFTLFETELMQTGQPVIVFQKIVDPCNQYKIEVDISNRVRCFTWNDEPGAERWHETLDLKNSRYQLSDMKYWAIIMHMGYIISLPHLLQIINQNTANEAGKVSKSLCSPAKGIISPCPAINTPKMVEA